MAIFKFGWVDGSFLRFVHSDHLKKLKIDWTSWNFEQVIDLEQIMNFVQVDWI